MKLDYNKLKEAQILKDKIIKEYPNSKWNAIGIGFNDNYCVKISFETEKDMIGDQIPKMIDNIEITKRVLGSIKPL